MVGMTQKSNPNYECRYCHKRYAKESTLAAHLCQQKQRWQQEKEVGVQLGLRAYLRFYEITQGSAKFKSYEDFVTSPYYTAFVRYGRHLVAIHCVNPMSYTEWLLKNNKKLDHWTKDSFYEQWLHQYLLKEAAQDAVERAIKTMVDYAEENTELRNGYSDYFRLGNANKICYHICTGRISAWAVFNCDSGQKFLESLNQEQLAIVLPWIDPDAWQKCFRDYPADVTWIRDTLKRAGL